MTVWYQKCQTSITQIKWCLLYFDDGDTPAAEEDKKVVAKQEGEYARFAARICEFFAIDQSEDFQIWNL